MPSEREALQNRVIRGYREFGISLVLFRNIIGEQLGLNVTDMECLDVLFFKGIATPTELSEYTGLTTGATTAMLDRLEKSGLIERQPHPTDRRGKLIVINKAGAQKVGVLFQSARQAQNELLSKYSDKELCLLESYFLDSQEMWETEREKLKLHLQQARNREK